MLAVDFVRHAREWIAAWNAGDLERILTRYAEGVELTSPFVAKLMSRGNGLLHGKPAARHYFAKLKTNPTLRCELIRLYSHVRSCVLEYRSFNGLRRAPAHYYDACVTKGTNTANVR